MRDSAATATATGAFSAAIAAQGALALGPRFVDLEVAAPHFSSVKSGNGLCCLGVIGHFHKSKAASTACFPIRDNMNAADLPKRLEERRQIGLRSLKVQVSDKKTFHVISLIRYRTRWGQNLDKRNSLIRNLRETYAPRRNATDGAACGEPWPQSGES